MKRPTPKEIKAAVDKLKDKPSGKGSFEQQDAKLTPKQKNQRIRKQGV